MSAYVVEDKTINSIVAFLSYHNNHETNFNWEVRNLIQELNIPFKNGYKRWDRVAKKLFNLNVGAVCQRYESDKPSEYRFNFQKVLFDGNNYQTIKSLQCFLYQCSEGNAPETKLFKKLEELKHAIALMIVEQSPLYEKASWGLH